MKKIIVFLICLLFFNLSAQAKENVLNKSNFKILDGIYSVCQLKENTKILKWIDKSTFYSITKTNEEFSIVCVQKNIPDKIKCERDWKIIKIDAKLDFSMIGVIAKISSLLAKNKISIFVISTYDTDYILVKEKDFNKTIELLDTMGDIN